MLNKALSREKASTEKKYWIRLTRACNNNCVFCLDSEAQDGSCIPLNEIEKELINGRKKNIKRVVLSGGEPTLHPQFLEIVKLTKTLGYQHTQVISNGRMFAYQGFLNSALEAGVNELTFSIHGHNPELHDAQTRVKGSFWQALTGLKNALNNSDLILNVDVVINKFNVKHLAEILKFFVKLGISEFDLLQVIPFGMAWDNKESVFYNIEGALIYLRKAFELSKNPNLYIWTNRLPAKYLEGFEELIQHPVKLYDEIGGRKEIFEHFLRDGKPIACAGEKCRYCFLEDLCRDIMELKEKGVLHSKADPPCFNKYNKKKNNIKATRYILKKSEINISKFLKFYIKHRYFIKGLRCGTCKFNEECDGARCNDVRKHGFKK